MFFEGLGVQYGPKIEENSLKMAVLAPRWAPLGDFWVILRHVGGKMATKSARMSQHRRQGANPRGFEGLAAGPDGREPAGSGDRDAFWLEGGRAESSNNILLGGSRLQKTRLEDPKIETLKHKVETSEASRLIGFLKVLGCWKIVCWFLVDSKRIFPQPGCPRGRRIIPARPQILKTNLKMYEN